MRIFFNSLLKAVLVLSFLGICDVGYSQYSDSQIVFANANNPTTTLDNLLRQLEKKFSVKFHFEDNTVQFKTLSNYQQSLDQQNLTDALNNLAEMQNLKYQKINEDEYLISNNAIHQSTDKPVTLQLEIVEQTISGTVTDSKSGASLPGVNVLAKGTSTGAVTDVDGKYRLTVSDDISTLVFSYIGFLSTEVPINGRSIIDIALEEDVQSLEEVVVIGYGTQKRSDLTGAVGSVGTDELQERPVPSLNQAISGRIAGVQVNVNSGRPGGKSNVRIRGFSSINSSNNPLYVVDGVQLPVGNQTQRSNAIDYINPNDIVSVEVLKDASSTAIYGARGANGVILITTKKGKSGEGKISYGVDLSTVTYGPNKPEVLNAKQYLEVEDLAWRNMEKFDPVGWAEGKWEYLNPALKRTDPELFDSNGNPYHDTDWIEETTQSKLSQNHQLSFSGGSDKTTYSLSLGFLDMNGLYKTSYLTRYSGRLTVDTEVKKWLTIGTSLSYNYQSENNVDYSDQVPRRMVEDFPFLPVYYSDGTYADNRDYPFAEGTRSSVHNLLEREYIINTQTFLGNVFANITLAKGLVFRTVLGSNMVTREQNRYEGRTIQEGAQGRAWASNNKDSFWSFENYLTYNKTFSDIHSFTGMVGISWQESNYFGISNEARTFATDHFLYNNIGAGSNNLGVGSGASREALNSYFGRFNYSLMNKYLLTVTGRMDGSSKFGDNNKYAFFPSTALAWRVSEEPFLQNSDLISNLKVRTSYGLTGNSEIPPYSSLSLLGSGYAAVLNEQRVGGTGLNRLANPDLRWEKTAQSDIGVEVGFFDGRIAFEADYYYRKTTDMLLDAPVPQTSGYATIRRNVGSMENKGVELALNTVNITTPNFEWRSTFNISFNRNKVLELATRAPIFGVGGPGITNETSIITEGESASSFWGLVRLGVWGTDEAAEAAEFTSYRNGLTILPGDIKYLDVNGDKAITDADRMIIGDGSPDGWGSFINNFRFGNFDFMLDLQFSYGNDIMDMNLHSSEDRQALANSYATVLNAWTPDNQNTMIAQIRDTRAGYVTNVDSHWVQDGSFIRGRNMVLGYTFPKALTEKMFMSYLRVYVSAQNFFLIVNDEVIGDPEITPIRGGDGNNVFSQGMKWHEYPKPTTYTLGLKVDF
ncbi:SusC/RagA family TonB-linked outer membrane protein [Chondrinema litorale]|uniref:SusC/RagA family TonB-linked outer membrane protein n=1 Tax=Chondrinema litorale TaxID=2994555 RepID=UPI002542C05C|nr:SusC/RagA family TonB-linked outer membrane protein [Chondrinema litorale]UZR98356.1 SusC/RagA family TonB-linked outer membrane protein [Chondrinema litorale]